MMQNDVQTDLSAVVATEATIHPERELRVLSSLEIEAVAGGPEGEVGCGTTPPR